MAASNNQPDSWFIGRVRKILRDQPVWVAENIPTDGAKGALTAGNGPFRLQRAPVMAAGVVVSAPGGINAVVYDGTPAGTTGNLITDTGEVIFATAPATGTLAITYQAVRYSDQQILDALLEGLNNLWPEVWQPETDSTSIQISINTEYTLPPVFQDQRAVLLEVEFIPVGATTVGTRMGLWRIRHDGTNPTLVLGKAPPFGGQVMLTYASPLNQLGAIPTLAQYLPVYYAVARLLLDGETMRSRADDIVALTGEGADTGQRAMNTANFWLTRFDAELKKMALETPVRASIRNRSVERLNLRSAVWNSGAA